MDYTDNLKLQKPPYTDDADIAVINANMDTIDEKITDVEGELGNYLPLTGGELTGTLTGTTIVVPKVTAEDNTNIEITAEFETSTYPTINDKIKLNSSGFDLSVESTKSDGTVYKNQIKTSNSKTTVNANDLEFNSDKNERHNVSGNYQLYTEGELEVTAENDKVFYAGSSQTGVYYGDNSIELSQYTTNINVPNDLQIDTATERHNVSGTYEVINEGDALTRIIQKNNTEDKSTKLYLGTDNAIVGVADNSGTSSDIVSGIKAGLSSVDIIGDSVNVTGELGIHTSDGNGGKIYASSDDTLHINSGGGVVLASALTVEAGIDTTTVNLSVEPTNDSNATTKNYVDSNFLSLSGGTLTGNLSIAGPEGLYVNSDININGDLFLSNEPIDENHATTKKYVDKIADFVGYSDDDIYGVEVDYENKKFTRLAGAENLTAGADFDSLTPWGGRKRCNVTNDGNVSAYYGDDAYSETGYSNGEVFDDSGELICGLNEEVQVMVEQPIFYTKTVPVKSTDAASGKGKQGKVVRYYISPMPKTGFTVPRAFYDDNGIVQDKIYLSAYEGCLYDASADTYITDDSQVMDTAEDMLSSIAGVKPMSGTSQALTRANARTIANNRGTGWQLHNIFAMSVTQWLFMIEYASLDPQRKVGNGVSGLTDDGSTNMAINTGGTAGLGNGSGIDTDGTDGECCVSYRGEENLWGNISTWLDGINILAKGFNEVWIPKIGTVFVDDTTEGYDCLDFNATHKSGYVSAYGIDGNHSELFIPTEAGGNSRFADYVYQKYDYDGFSNVRFGGRWSDDAACGFYLYLYSISSNYIRYVGSRLMYIPQTTIE